MNIFDLGSCHIIPGKTDTLFLLHDSVTGREYTVTPPIFEVNGELRGDFHFIGESRRSELPRGGQELVYLYASASEPALQLETTIRAYPGSPFVRMRYTLVSDAPVTLTRNAGSDNLQYLKISDGISPAATLTEIQLSHFDPVAHSYLPLLTNYAPGEFGQKKRFPGPVAIYHTAEESLLLAYEHGADCPDSFLEFVTESGNGAIELELNARKGNYPNGRMIDKDNPFVSIWFELGVIKGDIGDMLHRYRDFFLDEVCENIESRKPYIYYNTWNHQERNKYFKGLPYLESMTEERILSEIDVAHRMGIEVFVIDTGWYIKTGDWLPNTARFPDGLKSVKARLDEYEMKLGLWFNPIVAARTSAIYLAHPEYCLSWKGVPSDWGSIWETEESFGMCIASDYADNFIQTMIRLHKELGVVYFKWDAIGQYGCDSPLHNHGTESNSPSERADCYAFEMGRSMIRIVEEVSRKCPDVIVDFDITEGGRFVGLGFLSVGKYFLCNNGPYFHDFNIPSAVKMEPDTINVFFYPGSARSRVCRQGARYDTVIPSILFLTHYLPDAPALSQRNSLAALMLGGNGIWGDLVAMNDEDISLFSNEIGLYRLVRDSATRAYPRVTGFAGSSAEVHEKLLPSEGSGFVAFFTVKEGEYTHITAPLEKAPRGVVGADDWKLLEDNRLLIKVKLERDDAKVVYVLPAE